MKRSSLPQLLAAPAVAGILLFSSVDSAQAKSYSSNDLISSAAIGIFFGMMFSGIATYVALNIPHKDSNRIEKNILSKISELNSDMTVRINSVNHKFLIEEFGSKMTEKVDDVNQNISKLFTHNIEELNSNMREEINNINKNFEIKIADAQKNTGKKIEGEIVRFAGEIRGYIKGSESTIIDEINK